MTAASEEWLLSREPIFYAGELYYPEGPTVFFNGQVMDQVGFYRGIPLYEITSQIPFTVIYVPVGDNLMRPYQRRRDLLAPARQPEAVEVPAATPLGTAGATQTAVPDVTLSAPAARSDRARADVWIEWNGARWYVAGPAVRYDADRFTQVGTYFKLPVYRVKDGGDELFVTMVSGGPITPFRTR